ncbi:hypothetical protein EVAR_63027_1 [Eumeta japonica]|uniref:Uncharacterized protein n=1 Tax=Eumeta variegata TaxID=151549 RepID=A0A4C1YXF4_EUMVA|nr:hypothetical protein EVAR_63027_1 [Eumeta japonica]
MTWWAQIRGVNEQASYQTVIVTAAHGHSLPQRSHGCVAGLGRDRIDNRGVSVDVRVEVGEVQIYTTKSGRTPGLIPNSGASLEALLQKIGLFIGYIGTSNNVYPGIIQMGTVTASGIASGNDIDLTARSIYIIDKEIDSVSTRANPRAEY